MKGRRSTITLSGKIAAWPDCRHPDEVRTVSLAGDFDAQVREVFAAIGRTCGLTLLAKENFSGYQPGQGGLAGQSANPGDRPPERHRVDAPQGQARHDPPITSADHWSPMGVALRRQYRGGRIGCRSLAVPPNFTYTPKVLRCIDMKYAMSRCARVPMMLGLLGGEA